MFFFVDTQFALWAGVCYLTPLLGGYIADTYMGRFRTILAFCLVYVLGLGLVVLGSAPSITSSFIIFTALYIISLGTGGIKPNVSTFGADQFSDTNSQDREEKASFFNYFYWSVNLGSCISYLLVAYICQYGIVGLGGKDWSFFVGWSIPLISMTLGIIVFVSGKAKYKMLPPGGSVVADTVSIIKQAIKRRKEVEVSHWLDAASTTFGGSFSDDKVLNVKYVMDLVPFLGSFTIFWAINRQMSTSFQNQGCMMSLTLGLC